ncbi:hypothetical protein BC826DRAFT_1109616 [Russula brevipes]|nr:hypothetical protein BC826DRAFT_1109616 [Russula brevipes]
MSQAAADIEKGDGTDGHPEQPQLVPNQPTQPSHGGSNFGDSSGPLFSMYSKTMMEEDVTGAERFQKDADSVLIFAGLFSATVGALLTVSIQDLRQNPQDVSAFYLEKIYRILAESNAPSASIPSTVAELPPFSPPRYAVWVNSLWILSLAVSLTSAGLGSSLQQWARRYVRVTQRRGTSPEKQARIRAIFFNGLKNILITWEGEELTAFLHFSFILFVVGCHHLFLQPP